MGQFPKLYVVILMTFLVHALASGQVEQEELLEKLCAHRHPRLEEKHPIILV